MRVIIDSEKTMQQKQIFNNLMMEWETTLIITISFYIHNSRVKEHEIKIRVAGASPETIAHKVMEAIERRDWEGTISIDAPRFKSENWEITEIELRDTAGVLAWLRDMKVQLKNLLELKPLQLKR